MKLLLYCTKAKPYLFNQNVYEFYDSKYITSNRKCHKDYDYVLNGKIVAECDFEVEEIKIGKSITVGFGEVTFISTPTLQLIDLSNRSCLSSEEIETYLGDKGGYAIHIKNLHIFDEPKELEQYCTLERISDKWHIGYFEKFKTIKAAPQNMQYAYDVSTTVEKNILISIQSQWMCLILNRIKDVELRRVILKEMLK